MRQDRRTLEVPAANANGAPHLVDRYVEKTVLVTGTFTGTVRVQGSIDGTGYMDLGTFTAAGFVNIEESLRWVRIHCDAGLTGTPVASFAGFDSRTF